MKEFTMRYPYLINTHYGQLLTQEHEELSSRGFQAVIYPSCEPYSMTLHTRGNSLGTNDTTAYTTASVLTVWNGSHSPPPPKKNCSIAWQELWKRYAEVLGVGSGCQGKELVYVQPWEKGGNWGLGTSSLRPVRHHLRRQISGEVFTKSLMGGFILSMMGSHWRLLRGSVCWRGLI